MPGSRSNSSGRDRSDRLPDLDEANVYGVDDQPVVEHATTEVIADRCNRRQDVLEPLVVSPTHNGIASASTCLRHAGLERFGVDDIHVDADDLTDLAGEARQGDQPDIATQIYEQVDITVLGLVAVRGMLPNTRTLLAPRRVAVSITARRWRRRRRPSGVSGSPRRRVDNGRRSTTSSWPAASMSLVNIASPGSRRSDS